MGRKSNLFKKFLKLCVVVICATGFLHQTIEFLLLYWTYPTVVDIQVSTPSEIELPGISICNTNGIYPEAVCDLRGACPQKRMIMPENSRIVTYNKTMKEHELNASSLKILRKPLEEYLKCKIVSDGRERDCNLGDAIVGSHYSETFMPGFCYSFNTLWSSPNKKIEKIKKSERVQMEFFIDTADRGRDAPMDLVQNPKYNYPAGPAVQLAVHSPYISPSPFVAGQTFLGGKKYEINLKQDEKHLLPPPYQTNCTDYMPTWYSRGGVGPLNQLMVIQECKLNASLEILGCVPITIDYPHNKTLCKLCDNCNDTVGIWDHCTDLLDFYQQPCFFITYDMEVEEKIVYLEKEFESRVLRVPGKAVFMQMGYNCTFEKMKTRRCMTINIEFVFDNFEITNITYNPKFESLELFSVIGGYMGMYLGVSIVAMYDFAEICIIRIFNFMKKRKTEKRKQKALNRKVFRRRSSETFQYNGDIRKRNTVNLLPYEHVDRF